MCGISGIIVSSTASMRGEQLGAIAEAMSNTLAHRGPDSDGVWVDEQNGVALAHRRLAIQDMSSAGHQPMKSQNGRYVISLKRRRRHR